MRIRLLGRFQITVGNRVISESGWQLRKAAHLVKILALAPEHRLHRERVLDLLWPDLPAEAAANNLRVTLHGARRTLTPEQPGTPGFLQFEVDRLTLSGRDPVQVDVTAFELAAAAATGSGDLAAYQEALDLYTGDLLPDDLYEEWLIERREALRETHQRLLLDVAHLHARQHDVEAAIDALRRVLAGDPAHEGAHAGLMHLYAISDRRLEALRQYQHLREALQHELDVEPDPASTRLYEEILANRFSLESNNERLQPATDPTRPLRPGSSVPRSASQARSNLPTQLTSFIGREGQIAEIAGLISQHRLVTLTGPGGSGKTRLAQQVAGSLVGTYPDGVWFVELARITDPALVPQMIASVLELREDPAGSLNDMLTTYLGGKRLLLVLDNCEHLVQACAVQVDLLLRECPHLRVLATSRETLGVAGELGWPVPPLQTPEPGSSTPGQIEQIEAVRLFIDRARLVQPDFSLTDSNAAAVAGICAGLEGIPLAIELAAARVKALSPEQIAERLGDSLHLLSGGGRAVPARHRAMRATIEWSWQLLPEPDRRLFRRLAVFSGGYTLEAAEAICADVTLPETSILDLLFALVDKSLVSVEEPAGQARYRMLETIRQFALEQLEAGGELPGIQRRHADCYLMLAEQSEALHRGPEVTELLEQLAREHDNLRTALRYYIDHEIAEPAMRLGWALWRFWAARGYLTEGRHWLSEILALADTDRHVPDRMRALFGAGRLAYMQGDYAEARARFDECLAIAGDHDDRGYIAGSLVQLGHICFKQGDNEGAWDLYQQGLKIRRELGDAWFLAVVLDSLGQVALAQRDYSEARGFFEEGLELYRKSGDQVEIARPLFLLGQLARQEGNYGQARRLLGESLDLWRAVGDRRREAMALTEFGYLALDDNDHDRARSVLLDALALHQDLGVQHGVADCLEGVAEVAAERGEATLAFRLAGAAAALRATIAEPLPPDRQARLDRARQMLDDRASDSAWSDGQRLTIEQAIEEARSDSAS